MSRSNPAISHKAPIPNQTVANGLSHYLVEHASALLQMAMRLDGTYPAMHINAEFQSLEIMAKDMEQKIPIYRGHLCPDYFGPEMSETKAG